MAWNPPHYNLVARIWTVPQNPAGGFGPSHVDVPCQVYFPAASGLSRGDSLANFADPMIWIRFPPQAFAMGAGDLLEVPSGSGRYYQCRWSERAHQGFPNEYWACLCFQANTAGQAFYRRLFP